jgi:membrane protein
LLLTLVTYLLSILYDSEYAERNAQNLFKSQAWQMVGNPSASEEIKTILENNKTSEGKWRKTLISFVGIVIGATGVMAARQAALNRVWEVKPDRINQVSKASLANG